MGVTVCANGLSVVHQGSGGEANASVPDVCLTKVGKPIVPIPYGNNAKSADLADGTTTVTMDGGNSIALKGSIFACSTGDAGGDHKGIASGTIEAEAKFITASPNVIIEGRPVSRLSDMMTMNKANTICFGVQNPSVTVPEEPEKPNTLQIKTRYPNGAPLADATFEIKDAQSADSLQSGTLDGAGQANITFSGSKDFYIEYGESPATYLPRSDKIENPEHGTQSNQAFFDYVFTEISVYNTTFLKRETNWEKLNRVLYLYGDAVTEAIIKTEARFHFPLFSSYQECNILAGYASAMIQQSVDEHQGKGNVKTSNNNLADIFIAQATGFIDKKLAVIPGLLNAHPDESYHNVLGYLRHHGEGDPQGYLSNIDWSADIADQLLKPLFSLFENIIKRLEYAKNGLEQLKHAEHSQDKVDTLIAGAKLAKSHLQKQIKDLCTRTQSKLSNIKSTTPDYWVVEYQGSGYASKGGGVSDVVYTLPALAPKHLEIIYVDADGSPIANIPYKVVFDDGSEFKGTLDENGYACIEDTPTITAKVFYGKENFTDRARAPLESLASNLDKILGGKH